MVFVIRVHFIYIYRSSVPLKSRLIWWCGSILYIVLPRFENPVSPWSWKDTLDEGVEKSYFCPIKMCCQTHRFQRCSCIRFKGYREWYSSLETVNHWKMHKNTFEHILGFLISRVRWSQNEPSCTLMIDARAHISICILLLYVLSVCSILQAT